MSARQLESAQFSDSSDTSTHSQKTKRRRQLSAEQKESAAKRGKMSIEDVITKLDKIIKKMDENQPKIDQFDAFIQNQNKMFEKINSLETEIDDVKERQQKVDNTLPNICGSLSALTTTQTQMSTHINKLEQTSLKNHFVIHHLPPDLKRNDAFAVVASLGQALEIHLEIGNFSTPPYIVQQKNKMSSSIMGAFFDLRQKNQLFAKYKSKTNPEDPSKRRPIFAEDVCTGLHPTSKHRGKEIFLRNLLTSFNRNLLYNAQQQLKINGIFKYVWENDGRILARKDDKAKTFEIHSNQHLQDIIEHNTRQTATKRPPNVSQRSGNNTTNGTTQMQF